MSRKKLKYKVGDRVKVVYDPYNPENGEGGYVHKANGAIGTITVVYKTDSEYHYEIKFDTPVEDIGASGAFFECELKPIEQQLFFSFMENKDELV